MADTLPKEMWIHIWSFIDFDTLQKICTEVCKSWLDEIRGSAQLSSKLQIDNEGLNAEEINEVLFHWPRLKVLELTEEMYDYQGEEGYYYEDQIDFKLCPDLRKVIYKNDRKVSFNSLGLFTNKDITIAKFEILRLWFDPKDDKSHEGPENVLELEIDLLTPKNEVYPTEEDLLIGIIHILRHHVLGLFGTPPTHHISRGHLENDVRFF